MRELLPLFHSLSTRQRRQFLVLLLALLVSAFAEMAKIGAVLPVIGMAAATGRQRSAAAPHLLQLLGSGQSLLVACGLLIGTAVFAVAARLILVWLTHRFVVELGQDISDRIFARMLRQPYEEYKKRSSSEILSGFDKVRTLIFFVLLPAMQAFTAVIVATTIVLFLLVIDPVVASIAAASMGGIFLVAHLATRRRLHRNSQTIATAATTKMAIVQEALGNIRDILIDRTQPVFERNFRDVDARLRRAQSINMLTAAGPGAFIESAAIVALVGATLAATGRPGGVIGALPALGALALGAQRLLPLLQQVYAGWAQVAGNVHSVADVVEFMQLPVGSDIHDPVASPDATPFDAIVLKDVSFGFTDTDPVLRGIDLHIPRGACVGIVGESGSGKSTLVDIIMGLLKPTSGTITIGGEAMDDRLRQRWQSRIAHVPQSVYLSDASISSNIAFGIPEEAIDRDRVATAARTARAADFIEKLPGRYDTRVGEGGARLSGGERQRIGIARALYKRADVLILDEATSALAEGMEAALLRSLHRRGATLVMVSHRRSSLAHCDFVIQLADGRAQIVPAAH